MGSFGSIMLICIGHGKLSFVNGREASKSTKQLKSLGTSLRWPIYPTELLAIITSQAQSDSGGMGCIFDCYN